MAPRPTLAPVGRESDRRHTDAGRQALGGFFLTGLLMSVLGAILPAWGYHLHSQYLTVGHYFLSLNLGMAVGFKAAQSVLPRIGIGLVLVLACVLAFLALLFLAVVSPPSSSWWRMMALIWIGYAAGLLNTAVFQAISPVYRQDPASTVTRCGALFGAGCLVASLVVAGTFYIYTVPSILFLIAVIPGFFAILYAKSRFPPELAVAQRSLREAFQDFKSPGAILFSALLFFQFGNEWSIAGWLPLFLIQRLGASPLAALLMLSLYCLALLLGRLAAPLLLAHVRHGMLLMGSALGALLGCVILAFTNNRFGAAVGVLLVGLGFAMIYPLVVEKIGRRFRDYHPGVFNSIFSFAVTGGLIAPWTLGYMTAAWGIQMVMLLPVLGTTLVFFLLLVIWLEAKLSAA